MEGIGEILREKREKQGIHFDEVEDATKIKKRYLQALEAEDWNRLPGKVYAKGFLRTYARYLDLDESGLADRFELALSDEIPLVAGPPQRTQPKQKEVDLHNKPRKKMVAALCVLSVVVFVIAQWIYKTHLLPEGGEQAGPPPSIVMPLPDPMPGEALPVEVEPEPEPVTDIDLCLTALEDCWLRIKDGERQIYEGTIKSGETLTFTDIQLLVLRMGNPGGVQVELNGIMMPALGNSWVPTTRTFSVMDGQLIDEDTGETIA